MMEQDAAPADVPRKHAPGRRGGSAWRPQGLPARSLADGGRYRAEDGTAPAKRGPAQ